MSYQIQFRRGLAATWTSTNPTLANGEIGYETDTAKLKIGDGSTVWTSLAYWSGGAIGDVVGPASATDNAVARYDTTTGKLIQNSGVTVDDNDYLKSARYYLGLDLSAIPVSGGQSVITTWHGMQLVGNKQSTVEYTPANVGTNNQFGIIVPSQDVDADASFAIARKSSQTGDLFRIVEETVANVLFGISSAGALDIHGDADFNDNDIGSLKSAAFVDEHDNGNSGATPTVAFVNGQKQRLELNAATVTLALTFPGVGNYVLRVVQDATTVCTSLTISGSPKFPGGDLVIGAAANSETILTIYYDGTTAYIASIPNVATGTVSFA